MEINASMTNIRECIICGSIAGRIRFSKKGSNGKSYTLVQCGVCRSEFLDPAPGSKDTDECYGSNYFSKRTDRGYDNYFSSTTRTEIERVIKLNLKGIGFNKFENTLQKKKRSLDIGCAAGYFVNYLHANGWDAQGIDVSKPCTDFASSRLGLNIINGDYLSIEYLEKFECITMWATIEHLSAPDHFIKKIHTDLKDNGILIISTCRQGGFFQKIANKSWRYYNFPEHIYFFNSTSLKKLLKDNGFTIKKCFTYGSGFGPAKSIRRKIADFIARHFYTGDMIVIAAVKDSYKRSTCK